MCVCVCLLLVFVIVYFFALHKCVVFYLNSILNMYTDNLMVNDAYVKRFVT